MQIVRLDIRFQLDPRRCNENTEAFFRFNSLLSADKRFEFYSAFSFRCDRNPFQIALACNKCTRRSDNAMKIQTLLALSLHKFN